MGLLKDTISESLITEASQGEEFPEEIKNFLMDELEEVADLYEWNWEEPSEVESKSRDGFWAWTDGGVEVKAWNTVDMMLGTGAYPKKISKPINSFEDDAINSAKDDLISNHPELKDVDFDIDYNTLYDNNLSDYAEELSEIEREYTQDTVYEAKIGVYYYKDENFHNPIGKGVDAISVFAELALEGAKKNDAQRSVDIAVDFSSDAGINTAIRKIKKILKKIIKIYE